MTSATAALWGGPPLGLIRCAERVQRRYLLRLFVRRIRPLNAVELALVRECDQADRNHLKEKAA